MAEAIFDRGVVTRVAGNKAYVEIPMDESCEKCGAKILCAPGNDGEQGLPALNPLGAKVGQNVLVTESGELLLKLTMMQYGLPLIGFLLGLFAFNFWGMTLFGMPAEMFSFIGGLFGLGLGGLVSWKWAYKAGRKSNNYFTISKIYNGEQV